MVLPYLNDKFRRVIDCKIKCKVNKIILETDIPRAFYN